MHCVQTCIFHSADVSSSGSRLGTSAVIFFLKNYSAVSLTCCFRLMIEKYSDVMTSTRAWTSLPLRRLVIIKLGMPIITHQGGKNIGS